MADGASSGELRALGEALGRIRRRRRMSRRGLACILDMPLATYDDLEAGRGLTFDRLAAFAAATDCDLPALLLCPHFGSSELAVLAADNKAVSIALSSLEEVMDTLGEGLSRLTAAQIFAAFDLARAAASRPVMIDADVPPLLAKRQIECLRWAQAGKSSPDIGQILGISRRTVDDYIAEACIRLGVRTRVQAVSRAIGLGYLSP